MCFQSRNPVLAAAMNAQMAGVSSVVSTAKSLGAVDLFHRWRSGGGMEFTGVSARGAAGSVSRPFEVGFPSEVSLLFPASCGTDS